MFLWPFTDMCMCGMAKNLSLSISNIPSWGQSYLPYLSCHSVNKCPSCVYVMSWFLYFCGFGDLKDCQLHCAEVLPSVSYVRGLWCALWRKYMLGKFHSDMSYSAVGREFMLMNQQSRHPSFYCPSQIPRLTNRRSVAPLRPPSAIFLTAFAHFLSLCHLVVTRGSQEPHSIFPSGATV